MKREKLVDACQLGEFMRELELAFEQKLVEEELVIEINVIPASRWVRFVEGVHPDDVPDLVPVPGIGSWDHKTGLSDEDFSAMVERARDRAEDLVEQMLNP
jgi:hypothetical protein